MNKNDLLDRWLLSLVNKSETSIRSSFVAIGEFAKHLGPMMQFARVEMEVRPHECFDVLSKVQPNQDLIALKFPDVVLFGALDVFMVHGRFSIKNVLIIINNVEIDTINTSSIALREAGRNAAEKLVSQIYLHV